MNKLIYKATQAQWKWLEGLAFWTAETAYIRERYGVDDPDYIKADASVKSMFDHLDRLNVPFWVQNAVCAWAGEWRRFEGEYMENGLARRGYDISRG